MTKSDIPESELLSEIEAFCQSRDITLTDFGRLALNDTAFVTTIKAGRELRRATRQKVLDYMRPEAAE